jgi:hypothetical protein
LKALKGHTSILLKENGVLIMGSDLEDAYTKLNEIAKKVIEK